MSERLRLLPFLFSLLLAAAPAAAQDPAPWEQELFNPQAAAGDLVLPMPCGGAMAFRPIEVTGGAWLDDLRIEVGNSNPDLGYKEGRLFTFIAGTFTETGPNGKADRRRYYIAKYETTELQWEALSGTCPSPSRRRMVPQVDVSWFDAVDFSRRYTEWLMANARQDLPVEGELPGFVRLPTEAEWEFAARGGLAVDLAAFIGDLFPMPDGETSAYVWYQGSESAGGRLQPAGLLRPNPLGLFDMVGNASEMVLEPFRLNRRGRLHGQAGGFIAKGGDFLTSRAQLRTGARNELAYFSERDGVATALRQLGFRLVLTAPAIVSPERVGALQEEWALLPAADSAQVSSRQEAAALTTLDAVTRNMSDGEAKATLELVARDLQQAITERNDARDRAVRALVSLGAFFGNKLRTDQTRLNSVDRAITEVALPAFRQLEERVQGRADAAEVLARAQEQLDGMYEQRGQVQAGLDTALSYYGNIVITVAGDYSADVIAPQLAAAKVEFEAQDSAYLGAYADIFVGHIEEFRRLGTADTARWLDDILK